MSAEPYEAITSNFIPEDTPAQPDETPVEDTATPTPEVEAEDTPVEEPVTPAAPVEEPAPESEDTPEEPSDDELGGDDATEQAVADAVGISVQELADEFIANGSQWSDETTAKLTDGVSRLFGVEADEASQLVSDFAEGKRAQAKLAAMDLYSVIGGEDQYPTLQQWAKANLTPDQLAAHDRSIANAQAASDLEGMKDALRALKSQYDSHVGTARTVVESDGAPPSNEPPIMSVQELARIKGTDAYKNDEPGFRASVTRRLAAGKATGQYRN